MLDSSLSSAVAMKMLAEAFFAERQIISGFVVPVPEYAKRVIVTGFGRYSGYQFHGKSPAKGSSLVDPCPLLFFAEN
jgi:hypothetical protein